MIHHDLPITLSIGLIIIIIIIIIGQLTIVNMQTNKQITTIVILANEKKLLLHNMLTMQLVEQRQ